MSIHLRLSLLYNRRQTHMNEAFIRKVVIDVIDNKEQNDDTSSVHTFYTASSVPYVDRQTWKEFEKDLRSRLSPDVIRNNYALIVSVIEDAVFKDTGVDLSISSRISPQVEENPYEGSLRLGQDLNAEIATLPCFVLPARRNPGFYGRENELAFLDANIQVVGSQDEFRALVVHGIGGVGKSALAQEYAYRTQHHVDALLWVYCETRTSITQSFSSMAVRLGLRGAVPDSHSKNCELVLSWFHATRARWLIVYDNVDDVEMLQHFWPNASRGSGIVTTQRTDVAYVVNSGLRLQIKPWDEVTGANYLLNLVAADIRDHDTPARTNTSAVELSRELGGLPLAITHMAEWISQHRCTIQMTVDVYRREPSSLFWSSSQRSFTGGTSLNTIWGLAFSSLNASSRDLLTVLCFLNPDSVPMSFLELLTNNESDSPGNLGFCQNTPKFIDALRGLMLSSLVSRDSNTQTLSTNRLVQSQFLSRVGHEQRQRGFDCTLHLLIKKFPADTFQARTRMLLDEQSALYVPYVLSMQQHATRTHDTAHTIAVTPVYFGTIARMQWYCHGNNLFEAWDASLAMMMESSWLEHPMIQQDPLLKASFISLVALFNIATRKSQPDLNRLYQAYRSLEQEHSTNTLNMFEIASSWHECARKHWKQWSATQKPEPKLLPASMARDFGITQIWTASKDRPYEQFYGVIRQVEQAEPYDWNLSFQVHFALGTTSYVDNKLEKAEDHFDHALAIWRRKASGKHDPVVAMCNYRLGCIAARRHDFKTAVKLLQDACEMTKSWATFLKAEHARCVFKLSEVMAEDSSNSENKERATELWATAEKLLLEQDPNAQQPFDEGAYDSRVCIQWR
ncbi:P-loop containing nucleoside triphosphate hydrolase protein [Paraphoma chrysanthemicola]|nr:P-loop containing nucleoside triphosphate hydrolase protein [Paraphoma chrysanthemicola]